MAQKTGVRQRIKRYWTMTEAIHRGRYCIGKKRIGTLLTEMTHPNNLRPIMETRQRRKKVIYVDFEIPRSQKWKTAVKIAKTLPGADCGRNHKMLY